MPAKRTEECFECAPLNKEEIASLKALHEGNATPRQQALSLSVIVNKFARAHDMPYIPGSFDQSTFISGRAFVGQKILKYLHVPIGKLIKEEEDKNEAS
jgi:hypothetical protein